MVMKLPLLSIIWITFNTLEVERHKCATITFNLGQNEGQLEKDKKQESTGVSSATMMFHNKDMLVQSEMQTKHLSSDFRVENSLQ